MKQKHRPENPVLIKLPIGFGPNRIENTPVIFNNRPLLIENSRLTSAKDTNHITDMYIVDLTTTEIISRFGINFAFHCAYVDGNELNVFSVDDERIVHALSARQTDRVVRSCRVHRIG